MALPGPADRPFVGRVAEREILAAHVAAARTGSARVVLVSGEPGVGKTRLVEEALAGVAPGRELWGRCQEIAGAPAFWPWIQALRSHVRATPPERLRSELGDEAAQLARLVPAIRTRCPDVAEPDAESQDREAARFRLFDAVTMFLRTLAAAGLLVIVLDDLHWADDGSLLLLAFVARELRDLRLLVLGTYREAELRQTATAPRVLGDFARSSHLLTLAGLTAEDVGAYVTAACGRFAASETVEAIHRVTSGNAFFLTEVVQLLRARGQLDASPSRLGRLDLPVGVQEVIRRRIEPLSAGGRRTLHASRGAALPPGARLGILFPLGYARQAAGDDEGARAAFIEAAHLARDLGDAHTFPGAAVSAASGTETGTVDWTVVRLLEEAIELVGPRSRRRRSLLLAQLARSLYFADAARRHACSEEAVAGARRLGDGVVLLAALQARRFALWEPGEAARRRAIDEEILDLATATRDPMATADALAWRILDHLELAEMTVVHEALRRYRELAAACRLPRVRWHVTVVEATLAQLAGRLGDARSLARRALGLLAPSPRNNVAAFFGVQSFLVRAEEGRLAELEPLVTMAAEHGMNLPIWRAGLALLHAAGGSADAALQVLGDLGASQFGDLPRDGNLLGTYALLAEACALLDAPRFAEPLLALLAPHVDGVVVLATTVGCLGSAARYAGLLAHTLGRLDAAIAHFEAALAINERIGALPQRAHTQRELARSLRARGAPGDRGRAVTLEAEAEATAARLELVTLQQRLAADRDAARPAVVAVPAAPPPGPARHAAHLRHEGDVWTIACGHELTRLKDMKGLTHLVELLRHPGHELHALELGGSEDLRTGDAGEMLDADARRAYRARLAELRAELSEAEEFHDIGRAARLREEVDLLAGELTRASGLGGRSRRAGSDAERARLNVTRAVRKVVRRIQVECPVLGRHLDRCVQTGFFCAYQPDPAFPVDWDV